jgi:hypothetical protein
MSDFSCSINILSCLDWQRSNADKFKAFIQEKQDWYATNFCDEWNNWFDDVFNLATANDFGLAVWSIILDEQLFGIIDPAEENYPAWGFGTNKKNFNNGNFSPGSGSSYIFSTEEKRTLLFLKAYILHMRGTVSGENGINQSLFRIFGEKTLTCIDNRDMTFTYLLYDESISGFIIELYNRDLLPRPAGIDVSLVINAGFQSWGFGTNHSNFNNGNFYNGTIIGS